MKLFSETKSYYHIMQLNTESICSKISNSTVTPANITVIYHYLKTRMTESHDKAPEILAENFNEYKRILKII